jgi:hypothetical protein
MVITPMDLLDKYRRLNESYNKKLYFHLGVNAGFFSEFNNMLLSMLYCLDNGIQFILYSADANFRINRGWSDFFEPFCSETEDEFHHENNYRWFNATRSLQRPRLYFEKRRRGIDFLTHDLWRRYKSDFFARKRFFFPELGIEGGVLDATRVLHSIVWRYNDETRRKVESLKAAISLPESYLGIHIRSGDKVIEHQVFDAEPYVRKAASLSPLRSAFVLTDEYSVFARLCADFPDWSFRTNCLPEERGYFHEEYQKLSPEAKAELLVKLFAAMDILAGAEHFIGTFSSNPGMNLGMRMPEGRAHGIDYDAWKIRW